MVPALASLQDLELRLLHWINCEGESPLNDTIANFANDPLFGVPVFILLFLSVALTAAGRARLPRVVLTALVALALVHGVRVVAWRVAPRGRPGTLFAEAQILRGPTDRATCAEHPKMWVERGHPPREPSLPSSHVITAAAVAAALCYAAWWAGALGWLYALAVGFGRMNWGKHWPTDVLASLLLGALAGWAAWRLAPGIQAYARKRLARRAAGNAPAK